jgi:hypothetical protein
MSLLHWPTVFIQLRAMGTCGAPGAALCRAVGAKKIIWSSISELLGPTFFLWPGATGTRGALEAVLRWEVGAGAHGTHGGLGATLCR